MSIAPRDREAFDLLTRRSFSNAYVSSFAIEMQARRLTLGMYGTLTNGPTMLGTITFFGTSAMSIDNEGGSFPESVRVTSLSLSYDDEADEGHATLDGMAGWTIHWAFDGLAYTEFAATLASLADDDVET